MPAERNQKLGIPCSTCPDCFLLSLVRHRQVGLPRDRQDTRDFEQRDSLGCATAINDADTLPVMPSYDSGGT